MIALVLKHEIADFEARGYRDAGPSRFPSFRQMHLVPFDPPPERDDEYDQLLRAAAAMGNDND